MSPFKKITQQLGALDLKSPDLEDFATPMGPAPDLWPQIRTNKSGTISKSSSSTAVISSSSTSKSASTKNYLKIKSPSNTDLNAITSIQNSFKNYREISAAKERKTNMNSSNKSSNEMLSCSLPVTCNMDLNVKPKTTITTDDEKNIKNKDSDADADADDEDDEYENDEIKFNETHFDINGKISTIKKPNTDIMKSMSSASIINNNIQKKSIEDDAKLDEINSYNKQMAESKNEILLNSNEYDENDYIAQNCSIVLSHNGEFLNTKVMSSSPSANYYRPTEEPEPLDLTQLNIEASVMCLVSKVKFLCGRCGSPAVRLRQPKHSGKRGFQNFPPVSIELIEFFLRLYIFTCT